MPGIRRLVSQTALGKDSIASAPYDPAIEGFSTSPIGDPKWHQQRANIN